jgi:hypothetical protein
MVKKYSTQEPNSDQVDVADALRMLSCTCAEPEIARVLVQAADVIDDLRVHVAELTATVEKTREENQVLAQKGSRSSK